MNTYLWIQQIWIWPESYKENRVHIFADVSQAGFICVEFANSLFCCNILSKKMLQNFIKSSDSYFYLRYANGRTLWANSTNMNLTWELRRTLGSYFVDVSQVGFICVEFAKGVVSVVISYVKYASEFHQVVWFLCLPKEANRRKRFANSTNMNPAWELRRNLGSCLCWRFPGRIHSGWVCQ